MTALICFNGEYWAKVLLNTQCYGYIKCSYINYDIVSYIDDLNSIKNDVRDGFYGWYYPSPNFRGITRLIPRFVGGFGPCAVLCLTMFSYYLDYDNQNPILYYEKAVLKNEMGFYTGNYWTLWPDKFDAYNEYNTHILMQKAVGQLNMGLPVIISGASSRGFSHYVLIIGYKNQGENLKDFLVIDPYYDKPTCTNLDGFISNYNKLDKYQFIFLKD